LSAGALTQPEHLAVADRLFMTGRALLAGPFRLVPDLIRARGKWPIMQIVTTWAVALLLSGVFILLFASANPVIAEWLALVDPRTGHF
ncbi:UNVERIFIED_CONTAM: hypothetical protein NY100_25050, partial [Prevotella sp. 15_C9]